MRRHTVTLRESVLLIGVVLFAAAVALPVLAGGRGHAKGVVCRINMAHMTQAWLLYPEDNDGKLPGAVPSRDGYTYHPPEGFRVYDFAAAPQDEDGSSRFESVDDEVRGLQRGVLWPYIESRLPYHCPGDTRHLFPPKSAYPGDGAIGGYRSYSIGCVYNGSKWDSGTGEAGYVVRHLYEIDRPASACPWVEEADGTGYNNNTWNVYLSSRIWYDPFANWHNERSSLGFADGHVELHHWLERSTIQMSELQVKRLPVPSNEPRDYDYFISIYLPTQPF